MILDYAIKLLSSTNTLWGVPPYGIITDRKTGIAKTRRDAKKRRNRK